jgi:hypothetical protein
VSALDYVVFDDGNQTTVGGVLAPWTKRKDQAIQDRRRYERQWQVNMHMAAGNQHLKWSPRENRVLIQKADDRGRPLATADVLDQYANTVIGKLAADDFRPELLLLHDDAEAELYGDQVNEAFGWGWENEWRGDQKLLQVLRTLVKATGSCAVRCRYDRTKGALVGDVPHRDGKPILDLNEQTAHVVAQYQGGQSVDWRTIREGQVCWELLSGWNLLPPPGIEDAADFPWEIVVRPVALETLRLQYGAVADNVSEADMQALGVLGMNEAAAYLKSINESPTVAGHLKNHALVYTGYLKPTPKFPNGQTATFTHDNVLLDVANELPYDDAPYGARSGLTYFHWNKLPGRFWSRAFIEPGIEPQKVRNKRLTQIGESIDRGQPKVYAVQGDLTEMPRGNVLEVIELRKGASPPIVDNGVPVGAWMNNDVAMQDENVQKALGLQQVSLGQSPSGVSAYSAMALLTENDASKLDWIAQEFKLAVADLCRDTLEAMRQWPAQKQLLIAGDDDRLQAVAFNARAAIPPQYMVRPAKGGTLPRSQAAEVQKIADLWNAAVTCGAVAQDPVTWLEWYKRSLDAGACEDLPDMNQTAQQAHKAALENVLMARLGEPVPVAEYDNAQIHVPVHREKQGELQQAAMYGDQQAAVAVQAIEQHVQWHLGQAEANAASTGPQSPAPGGQDVQQQAYDNARAVQYENQVLSPRAPRVTA